MRITILCALLILVLLLVACGQTNRPAAIGTATIPQNSAPSANAPAVSPADTASAPADTSNSAANTPTPNTSAAAVAALGESDLVFTLNGTNYPLKTDAKPLLDALGKGYKLTQAPSCLYKGNDKTFDYAGISIQTFPMKDKDIIDEIDIIGTDYTTSRGVKVGDTLDQVKAAYGEGYDNGGVLEYVLGGDPTNQKSPMIYFQTGDDGKVSLIGLYSASNVQ